MNSIRIRKESPDDYDKVIDLIKSAFADLAESAHSEHFLVEKLRESKSFIPELSLVAVTHTDKIVGHILLTPIHISNGTSKYPILALAPLSVSPTFQRRGIGTSLIEEAHNIAVSLGFSSIVILGHPSYYTKFGYRPACSFGIKLPFEVPDEYCMVKELLPNSLADVKGSVIYPPVFL